MVMALKLTHHLSSSSIIAIAGYEGGYTAVHVLGPSLLQGFQAPVQPVMQFARTSYLSKPHSQPILSLDASPDSKVYYTSSADAVIAAHRVPDLPSGDFLENYCTGIDNPSNIGASAEKNDHRSSDASGTGSIGHSSTSKSPSSSSDVPAQSYPNDVSVSQKGDIDELESPNIDALSFSKKATPAHPSTASTSSSLGQSSTTASQPSGLSSLLASAPGQPKLKPKPQSDAPITVQPPYKTVHTKHAGQQSLRVRSDGRLLVTGGWDSRVRIYSTKSLKELAVLKWHNEGVYAAGFGEILEEDLSAISVEQSTGLVKLQRQRERQLQSKHWVVAGSKDGKVSLWEIY
jgi:WD40 repeat protein